MQAMKEIKRVLAQDGVFIMVDPFRKEGESLAAYRQRATDVSSFSFWQLSISPLLEILIAYLSTRHH